MKDWKDAYKSELSTSTGLNEDACFRRAESFEELYGKDLADWNAKEIIDYYKSLCTPSVNFLNNIHCVFRKYTNWCISKQLVTDNMNHYEEIDYGTLILCINKIKADNRIISRKQLLDYIKDLVNPRDKFICLACFEGFGGKKAVEIREAKLSSFKNGIVQCSDTKAIPYSKELYRFAVKSANTYVYIVTPYNLPARKFEMAGSSDQIIKKTLSSGESTDSSQYVNHISLVERIKAIQNKTGSPAFTLKGLALSGRIQMVKDLLKCRKDISMVDALKLTEPIYGKVVSYQQFIAKYKDFLK